MIATLQRALPRPLLIFFLAYLLTVGATYNGILTPDIRWLTLALLSALLLGWLGLRWRGRWGITLSAVDYAVGLGAGVIVLAAAANSDDLRRIAIGIWFITVYCLIAYLLRDLIGQRVLRRASAVDAVLIAGLFVVVLGWLPLRDWLVTLPTLLLNGQFSFPRPTSTLGNPNTLAAVLVLLLPLTVVAAVWTRGLLRALLIAYALAIGGLLVLTYSRGGWIGGAAALIAAGALLLHGVDLRGWWQRAARRVQLAVIALGVIALALGAGGGVILVRSLDEGGRGVNLRTFLYDSALTLFRLQPLTGHGLFTFGGGLAQLNPTPPTEPHSHAHNIVLHTAAELGIGGVIALLLIALAVGAAAVRIAGSRPTSRLDQRDRLAALGAAAALIGTAVHHLFDVPAMNPAVALLIVVVAVVLLASSNGVSGHFSRWLTFGFAAVNMAVLSLAVVSSASYGAYYQAIGQAAAAPRDDAVLRTAAATIAQIADSDPGLLVYRAQAGMLYASAGDVDAAIAQYRETVRLAPEYAYLWANLGVLLWEDDDPLALEALLRAVRLYPAEPWFYVLVGERLEEGLASSSSDTDTLVGTAIEHYGYALEIDPDLQLLPMWNDSPLRSELPLPPISDFARLALAIGGDQPDAAALYAEYGAGVAATPQLALGAIAAARAGDAALAAERLTEAAAQQRLPAEAAWIAYARAVIDPANRADHLATAREALALTVNDVDVDLLQNVDYIQFLTYSLPRRLVPQIAYPPVHPALLRLLADAEG